MKRTILLITFFILLIPSFSQIKIDGCCLSLLDPASSGLEFTIDSISFAFTPDEYFWEVSIQNHTAENLTCLWNETLFIVNNRSSRILFDYTIIAQRDDPLQPGIISPETKIIRSIIPADNVGVYATNPVFTKKLIKRTGERIVTLVIPVQTGDLKTEYKFTFEINLCE